MFKQTATGSPSSTSCNVSSRLRDNTDASMMLMTASISLEQKVTRGRFGGRGGSQGVGTRQVDEFSSFAMELNPAAGVVNRDAGEIGGDGTVSGNAVEQSAFAAVWLSDKSDPQSTSSTRILLARSCPGQPEYPSAR